MLTELTTFQSFAQSHRWGATVCTLDFICICLFIYVVTSQAVSCLSAESSGRLVLDDMRGSRISDMAKLQEASRHVHRQHGQPAKSITAQLNWFYNAMIHSSMIFTVSFWSGAGSVCTDAVAVEHSCSRWEQIQAWKEPSGSGQKLPTTRLHILQKRRPSVQPVKWWKVCS